MAHLPVHHTSASAAPVPPVVDASVVDALRAAGCVFAEDEARLLTAAARTPAELDALVQRRSAGLPLEHVVGWAEFSGLRIAVDAGVFVPRRRTEFLVERAAALLPQAAEAAPVVVDLCCGTGALAAAVAQARPPTGEDVESRRGRGRLVLHAADIDPAAVRCARRNLAPLAGRVHEGDLYAPLPSHLRCRVTVLLANVPYVPTGEVALLPPEARVHEPRAALDGGPDGLDTLRRVTAAAPQWLAPGGHLLFETGERQAAQALAVAARSGLLPRLATSPDGDATVVIAQAPPA